MIKLEDLQEHARGLIAANAYFSGETVLAELGLSSDDRESALNTRGFCISVLPIDEGRKSSQGAGAAVKSVSVVCLLEIQPKVNAGTGGAGKDIYQALRAVESSLLGYSPVNPSDRYSVHERAWDFSDHDPGLLAYLQNFIKLVV